MVLHHGLEKRQRAGCVVTVILARLRNRLADLNERGKVHHALVALHGEHSVEQRAIPDVSFNQFAAKDGVTMTGNETIERSHRMSAIEEQLHHVRADIARTADD